MRRLYDDWQKRVAQPDHPLNRTIRALPAPMREEWRALLLFSLVLWLGAGLFFELLEDMVIEDPLNRPDQMTYAWLQTLRSTGLDRFMVFITQLGDAVVVLAMAVAVGVWLIAQRAWRALIYWVLAVGGGSLINTTLKMTMQRSRPTELHYSGADAFSFPSGHSTTNALLYGFLIILIAREIPFLRRIPLVVGAVIFVGLIAFSRLYLGAHWLSDVAGGLAFGSAWLALLGIFYMWRAHEPINPRGLMIVAGVTLITVGGVNIALNHGKDMAHYDHRTPSTTAEALP